MKKNRKETKLLLSLLKIYCNVKIDTFIEALTHKSDRNENINVKKDYDRLEILGDSIVQKIVESVLIVGDDLYCTSPKILEVGIQKKATNSILIQLN